MRFRTRFWIVFMGWLVCACEAGATPPMVEDIPLESEEPIMITRRVYLNEKLPELGARLYDQVDYQLRLQQLDAAIELTHMSLQVQRERAEVYGQMFHDSPAFFVTYRDTQVAVREAELKLSLLRNERILLQRSRADQVRYRQLLLKQGESRLLLKQDPGVRYDQEIR